MLKLLNRFSFVLAAMIFFILAFMLLFGFPAHAQTGIINPIIDRVQTDVVAAIVGVAMTGFFGVLSWIGLRINIKVTEYFNRDAIELGANRFANSVIDELQRRFLNAGEGSDPQLTDLIREGVSYVKKGNPDAVKQSGIRDDRLQVIVEGALKSKAKDALGEALNNILVR